MVESVKKSARKLTAIDLFAGCGGLTQGLKEAGFSVVGAVENSPLAVEAYSANHKSVKVWCKDIRQITAPIIMRELKLKKGGLDLLAGCPPCQGFSSIRRLNGFRHVKDDRNNLIYDFLRLVKGLRPKFIMMENVPGLIKDPCFGEFVQKLENLGYTVKHDVKDAQHYGVPQRRARVIVLASMGKNIYWGECAPPNKIKTVRDAIGHLPSGNNSNDTLHNPRETRSDRIKEIIALIPKNGGSRGSLPRKYQLPCHVKCNGFKDVYGRMAWDKPAPTITAGCHNPSKGRFLHPDKNRNITLREAALLQGFKRCYKFSGARNKEAIASLIGNALPPEFIRRHAVAIKRSLLAG